MSDEKTTLEMIAPSVDEAVERGLEQLGVNEDDVDVEVLDSGTKGVFGLGTRQARVRLTVKNDVKTLIHETASEIIKEVSKEISGINDESIDSEDPLIISKEVVEALLSRMKVRARVETSFMKPADENDQEIILVDIQGNDLSILIGRRTETLNALQYITSLILGKKLERWVPIMTVSYTHLTLPTN